MRKKIYLIMLGSCLCCLIGCENSIGKPQVIETNSIAKTAPLVEAKKQINWGTLSSNVNSDELSFIFNDNTFCFPLDLNFKSEEDICISDTDSEKIYGYSEDGNLMLRSIETESNNLEVLGLKVGLDSESAFSIQREYGKTEPVIDLVDTEFANGFKYNNAYVEYMISDGTVISLYIRYDGDK